MVAPRRGRGNASIAQTPGNLNQRSPLNRSGKEERTTRNATNKKYKEESSDSSDDPLSTEETQKPTRLKPEPATDDEPLSTTDESDEEPPSPRPRDSFDHPAKRRKWSESPAKDVKPKQRTVADNRRRNDDTPKNKPQVRGSPQTAIKRTGRPGIRGNNASEESKQPKKAGNWKRGDDGPGSVFGNQTRRNRNSYHGGFQNVHAAGNNRSKARAATPSLSASDKPALSSQATGSPTEFKNPLSVFADDTPSSSFPTETSRTNDNPLSDIDLDPYGSTSSLSSAPTSPSAMLSAEQKERLFIAPPLPTPVCPVCGVELDEKFTEIVQNLDESTLHKQYEFCRKHRRDTAEKEWAERGYPAIDWNGFEQRVGPHLSALESIIQGNSPSFYRQLLESSSAGSNNIRLTALGDNLESLSCGYYGSKGMNEMSDIIICQFKDKLRQLSNSDSLIRAASVSGYIGQVLVPELTVMLVKEDMGIEDEDARKIINSSKDIGELLNEVESDVIPKNRRTSFSTRTRQTSSAWASP